MTSVGRGQITWDRLATDAANKRQLVPVASGGGSVDQYGNAGLIIANEIETSSTLSTPSKPDDSSSSNLTKRVSLESGQSTVYHRVETTDEVVVMTEVDADVGATETGVVEMTTDAEASVVLAETKLVAQNLPFHFLIDPHHLHAIYEMTFDGPFCTVRSPDISPSGIFRAGRDTLPNRSTRRSNHRCIEHLAEAVLPFVCPNRARGRLMPKN